jgi:diguanylate cyclase (GGDEF)-like protein/PAS domain S-box-containing protein
MIDSTIIEQAVNDSRDGISIADMRQDDFPLIFVNAAFERLTGYTANEALGINCRFLCGNDRNQPELTLIRGALLNGEFCLVTLRNYRKDGSMFWNELSLSPVHDKTGTLTHFIGMQRDVSSRILLIHRLRQQKEELQSDNEHLRILNNLDPLTGIFNRRYFDNQHKIQWNIALRSHLSLSLFIVDIDYFKQYNDFYGHLNGDECIRTVAKTLGSSLRRASDFVARYGGEEFVILVCNITELQSDVFAEQLRLKIESLNITHAKSPISGAITVSIGYCTFTPQLGMSSREFVAAADEALYTAKSSGRNRVISRRCKTNT